MSRGLKSVTPLEIGARDFFFFLFGMAVHGPEMGCIVYFVQRSAIGEWVALLHHRPSFSLRSMGLLGASVMNDPPIHYHLTVSGFSCLFEFRSWVLSGQMPPLEC